MRLVAVVVLSLVMLGVFVGCKAGGPGTPEYNKRHHIDETTPAPAMPNPDPRPPKGSPSPTATVHGDDERHEPERRGPGRPPEGKYVTFSVTAAKSMGTIVVTYSVGDGAQETFHMHGTKHWGTVSTVGTPVSVLAAPDKAANDDGTFKHGPISVKIVRAPANETEGGPIICRDDNGPEETGGAQCAGTV